MVRESWFGLALAFPGTDPKDETGTVLWSGGGGGMITNGKEAAALGVPSADTAMALIVPDEPTGMGPE